MPRPTTRPSWLGTRRAPTPAQRAFVPSQTPPAEWFNWIFGIASDWIDYLDDWIQNTGQPYANELERTLEMQTLYPAREFATSSVTMQANSIAAQVNASDAFICAVAVGNSGILMRYDAVRGETTHPTAAASFAGTWNDVIFAGGQFVAIGTSGTVQTSPDGITWTNRTGISSTYTLLSIAYGGGKYMILGRDGSSNCATFYSTDGITWTTLTVASTTEPTKVIWVPAKSLFYIFATQVVRSSPAGTIAWSSVYTGLGNDFIYDATWNPTLGFAVLSAAVSPTGNLRISGSADGVTWTNGTNAPANYLGSTAALRLLPFNQQIAVFYVASNTTYVTTVMLLPSLASAPQPNVSPRVLPLAIPAGIKRVIPCQSSWLAVGNTSSTQCRMYRGGPVETMRGIPP